MEAINHAITEKESNNFYVVKAFAMLSVVSAHVSFLMRAEPLAVMWNVISNLGVPWFFIISGYFFSGITPDSKSFWCKKAKYVVIPWIVCSTMTFGLECYTGTQSILLSSYAKWVTGYASWYYYLSVLLVLYLLFGYIKSFKLNYFCIIITVLLIIFSDLKLFNNNSFINIFNWCGFFALGIILRTHRLDRYIINNKLILFVCFILCIVSISVSVHTNKIGYFYIPSLIYEIASFPLILKLSDCIRLPIIRKNLVFIGKQTLFIFMTHMQVVQIIGKRIPYNILFDLLYPVVALEIMALITFAIIYVASKIKIFKKLIPYIGIKNTLPL